MGRQLLENCCEEKDKSIEKREDESPVRRTPAKKKRARKISSDSNGDGSGSSSSSDSNSSSDSSSSEDEAMAEDKVIDKSEEEQLRVLGEKRAAHKELKSRMREEAAKRLIRRAKRYVAARCRSQEAKKEAEETKAEQQEEEAEEAESSEADPAATEWVWRNRKERCIKRIVRERHIKERLGKPAPPAAGETSEAVADKAEHVCRPGKPAPPAAGETSERWRISPSWCADWASPLRRRLERPARQQRTRPSCCAEWQARKYLGESIPSANATSSLSRLCRYLWMAASSGPLKQHRKDSCSGSWWTQAWCCLAGRPRTTSGHTSNSREERTIGSSTAIEQ
jgi:hypothetical protein